uniref:Tetratricopeptide TPR_4 n=1 Tax=Caulobacter sp. (strain K31) TaxID=366602 RepID=B0T0C1_CAUSK
MRLGATLRSTVAAICILGVLTPSVSISAAPSHVAKPAPRKAAPHPAASGGLQVRVAQAPDFTRLEFPGSRGMQAHREGTAVVLRFPRDANPNLSSLNVGPPRWVKGAQARHVGGVVEIVVALSDDADFRAGNADGDDFINLFARAEAPAAPAPTAPVVARRPNPMPASGVVPVKFAKVGGQVQLSFDWANPAGAAVFRRGEAVWVVFDAPARLDVGRLPASTPQYRNIQVFKGSDYAALRISTPQGASFHADGVGAGWTVSLGAGLQDAPDMIRVARDDNASPATLTATVAGATKVIWAADPAVGDRLAVVTALAPAKGLPSRRDYVEMALLQSATGLAVESYSGDLLMTAEGDIVSIGRPKGLLLSSAVSSHVRGDGPVGAPQAMAMPALIDPEHWSKTGSGGFMARYDALLSAIPAASGGDGKGDDTAARMALARFLVGSNLSYEAIGVLNAAGRAHQTLMGDAEFRGLRGVAKVLARRYAEAEADFASPVLADDPSAALWRGYVASKSGQWSDASQRFAEGARALNMFPALWQARFLGAQAEAAVGGGAAEAAIRLVNQALKLPNIPVEDQLELRLTLAKAFELKGDSRALPVFQAIARSGIDRLAAPATLHAIQIRLAKNQVSADVAAKGLDQLRFRWRGDGVELDTIRALGQLQIKQGRYREALEVLHSAGNAQPDLPQAVALRNDLNTAFRALFLDGLADGMQPIQAVGLFYDFQDLTPIGADGDQMVRNLVRRLVDVDLLDEAAKLLKYQVDNRLNGVPKAQVATDLAWIYLMDRKPESALDAINATRTTVLPPALNAERRLATARALMGLGRYDAALEVVESDKGRDVEDVRADIAWKQHAWPLAGAVYERALGDRWKTPGILTPADESKLLRSAVAFSLADDDAALGRLRQRYGGFVDGARNPDGLRVALAGADPGSLSSSDFSKVTADNEAFNGWVAKMKDRFRAQASN